MGGGGGGKSKGSYKNPIQISSLVEWVGIAAIRGYSGVNAPDGADLDINQFLVVNPIEVEKSNMGNIGHPLYRPFMARRYGTGIGKPEKSQLAYDNINATWWAWNQLEDGMRVIATAKLQTMDDFHIMVGDTIAFDDSTMGVRRLWLVEGVNEDANGVELLLIDVIGG